MYVYIERERERYMYMLGYTMRDEGDTVGFPQ